MLEEKKSFLTKILPFLAWGYTLKKPKFLKRDITSGITVALILIPQSMAYAGLAGLPIEIGLYSSFIAVIVASLFGSAQQMSTGPVTIISLMTASTLAPIAGSGSPAYVAYASFLAFLIGIFYILLGNLKLGIIVDFLSHPVIIGFINAVSIITISAQLNKIFGITISKGNSFIEQIHTFFLISIDDIHIITTFFGVGSITLLILLSRYAPKLPKILILIIVSTALSYFIGYHEIFGGAIVENIPEGIPSFHMPILNTYTNTLSLEELTRLGISAIIIALIGFTESISVAKMVGYKTKQRISANKELIGQGLANISSSLFSGYAVAGSFSKTAVNLRGGAKTGFSSVVTGLVVILTLLFLTPLLYHLPLATLAGIVIFAVFSLIRISPIIKAWKIERHDAFIAIITFLLTIILSPNIEKAIIVGATLSLGFYIYRTMRQKTREVAMYKDGELRDVELFGLKTNKKVSVIRFDGMLYFANAGYFESEVLNLINKKERLRILIIDFTWMNDIDSSGQEVLENLVDNLNKSGITVYMCGIRPKITEKFVKIGFIKKLGEAQIFTNVDEILGDIEAQYGKKEFNLKHLKYYTKDNNKTPELEKEVIKNIK